MYTKKPRLVLERFTVVVVFEGERIRSWLRREAAAAAAVVVVAAVIPALVQGPAGIRKPRSGFGCLY